jgi:hypothetical protein
MGLEEGTIEVQQFRLGDRPVRIEDKPQFYSDFLAAASDRPLSSPVARGYQEAGDIASDIRKWDDRNQFVLVWEKEYWMTEDGAVEST